MTTLLQVAPYVYISIQIAVVICISIFGAVFVKKAVDANSGDRVDDEETLPISITKHLKLWARIVWKMRSVYSSFLVHIFDIFTDLLIIIEWLNLDKNKLDHVDIDPQIMAYNSIAILIIHKIIGIAGFWSKERNIFRCLLQLFDLIVVQEIYVSHLHIIKQYKHYKNSNMNIKMNQHKTMKTKRIKKTTKSKTKTKTKTTATKAEEVSEMAELVDSMGGENGPKIEITTINIDNDTVDADIIDNASIDIKASIDTTTSFKYIRNLEAIFESIPQSIIQLVFLMRTSFNQESSNSNSLSFLIISILSIIQSIISMTNSIINNDNAQMTLPKFKQYHKRLPPTKEFFKHSICRASEIIYRIGLLSLIWTVCQGLVFSIVCCFEILLLFLLSSLFEDKSVGRCCCKIGLDDLFLRIQTIIILPSELIYSFRSQYPFDFNHKDIFVKCACFCCCCTGWWCFYPCIILLSTHCQPGGKYESFPIPSFRIGVSLMEFIFLVLYGKFTQNGDRWDYLMDVDKGFIVFVSSIICWFIYSQYIFLFPSFSLPLNVSPRSKHGLAFNGELEELKRIKLAKFPYQVSKLKAGDLKVSGQKMPRKFDIGNEKEFWDEPAVFDKPESTPIMFALAMNQCDVINWLEKEKGIKSHRKMFENQQSNKLFHKKKMFDILDYNFARHCIDRGAVYDSTRQKDFAYFND